MAYITALNINLFLGSIHRASHFVRHTEYLMRRHPFGPYIGGGYLLICYFSFCALGVGFIITVNLSRRSSSADKSHKDLDERLCDQVVSDLDIDSYNRETAKYATLSFNVTAFQLYQHCCKVIDSDRREGGLSWRNSHIWEGCRDLFSETSIPTPTFKTFSHGLLASCWSLLNQNFSQDVSFLTVVIED